MNSQYYQDKYIPTETYTLSGGNRSGNKSIPYFNKYTGRLSNPLILKEGIPPNAYDILTCLQKYDVGSFEDFCWGFGYDEDSRRAEKIYNSVVEEYNALCMLYNDNEMEMLQEIQ